LSTIYHSLTVGLSTASRNCPSTGPHWNDVGFQGNDPTTDLRGSGMVGVLQLLYLAQNYKDLGLKLASLSRHEMQVSASISSFLPPCFIAHLGIEYSFYIFFSFDMFYLFCWAVFIFVATIEFSLSCCIIQHIRDGDSCYQEW
jgi:hypothetical protein